MSLPTRTAATVAGALCVLGSISGCTDRGGTATVLSAEAPLHLEDHLDGARVTGSKVPAESPQPVEWSFDGAPTDWRPIRPKGETGPPAIMEPSADALRVRLTPEHRIFAGVLTGGVFVELPEGWRLQDWSHVQVRVRTTDRARYLGGVVNLDPADSYGGPFPFHASVQSVPLVTDGTAQTYELPLDGLFHEIEGPWTHLGVWFSADGELDEATLDILSVRVVPREARYAAAGAGVLIERRTREGETLRDSPYRRTLYTHTPGDVSFSVEVPEGGHLDVGLGVVWSDTPVRFQVSAAVDGDERSVLLEETVDDPERWAQRSLDLSGFSGHTAELTLSADSTRTGAVALWANPTLSGERTRERPNVIFYVIDGASPEYMSVYGYNRRTTPNLERLAAEGAVFEHAYSNSSWTRPSTVSYVTSLQHSVFGGLRNGRNPVPAEATTMSEHLRRVGYQTALLTINANAGRMSGLERGVDLFRDSGGEPSTSSADLHANFWRWREQYPAEPFLVHFQTTDVHQPYAPVAPFAGLFITPERRRRFEGWLEQAAEISGVKMTDAVDSLGIDQGEFWAAYRDLHDEAMAHQDHRLGELVARLRATGEWERTLLIVAADHGIFGASFDYNLLMRDPATKYLEGEDELAMPILRPSVSHVPLIVLWPGRIAPGQRFRQPVSMIDVLPTILDLADLPFPEVVMGQSLAPLLLGEEGWEPRPVILDEFEVDEVTGEPRGRIEVINGRWGASLQIGWDPERPPERRRPAPLLLFDLWEDPDALASLHEERPDLVRKYTRLLQYQWRAHQALAARFTRGEETPMSPEQLEALRALGYIQ